MPKRFTVNMPNDPVPFTFQWDWEDEPTQRDILSLYDAQRSKGIRKWTEPGDTLTSFNLNNPRVSIPEENRPAIKNITTKNLPPAKGLGGLDLSTVDAELARLFSPHVPLGTLEPSGRYRKYAYSSGTDPYSSKPDIWGSAGSELENLVGEYNQIIPEVVRDISFFNPLMSDPRPRIPGYTILGMFSPEVRGINLNPSILGNPVETEATLAHELGHSTFGGGHPRNIYNIEGVGRMRGEAKEMWKNKQRMKGMGTR